MQTMSPSQTLTVIIARDLIYFIAAASAIWFIVRMPKPKKKSFVFFAAVSLPLILLVSFLASKLYYDPRPFMLSHVAPLIAHEPGNGFPSDHMLLGAAIASLVFRYDKRFGVLLFVLALMVGLARVHAGLHHIVDVLGSIVIAGGVTGLVYLVQEHVSKKNGKSVHV
jgi:membrane-associated phospholipid phosphatase